jgi:hypothetical protein
MLPPVLAHYMYPACWFVRNMNKPTLAENILIVITSFVVSWFLARFQKMPFIMEGAGTKFFGQSPSPDGRGYISTKWLVFVLIPMVPVRSYQIIEQYPGGQNSASVVMVPLERLAWFQVRETMWKSKVGYIIAVLVMFGFGVLPFWKCI